MVLTPGATSALTVSSTWRTMRPLRRIFSISPGDLQTIAILDCSKYVRRDLFHRLITVHGSESPRSLVILDEGTGLPLVFLQTLDDNFLAVVGPNDKFRPLDIADAVNAWRLIVNVVDPPAGGTRTTSGKPLQ